MLTAALTLPIETLAQAGAVLTLTVFTVVNLALVAIKRKRAMTKGSFHVPGWWPWLAALASGGVLAGEITRLVF